MALNLIKRLRRPAVAGLFYMKDATTLRETISQLTAFNGERAQSLGVIVPHGGLHQAGQVIGQTLARVKIPRRCIILGPNHTGWGESWSVMTNGAYSTPLGDVPVDEHLAERLLETCPLLQADDLGHRGEHSIEVLLPFLRHLGPADLMITPIVIRSEHVGECRQAAEMVAACVKQLDEPVLIMASADLAHDQPRETVQQKDANVIQAISRLDSLAATYYLTEAKSCGVAPITCAMETAIRLGAKQAQLVRYGTSAEAGGDPHSATGYAGMILN